MITIRKAERAQSKLRIGLSGPSGSGKTYSALPLARGIASAWEKIVLIDTENGSGEMYSNLGAYNVITLSAPFTPEKYTEAIQFAEESKMEVIVIDSVSHEWDGKGGCLEINEKLAGTKFKGTSWAAWSETTPRHQKFISSMRESSTSSRPTSTSIAIATWLWHQKTAPACSSTAIHSSSLKRLARNLWYGIRGA